MGSCGVSCTQCRSPPFAAGVQSAPSGCMGWGSVMREVLGLNRGGTIVLGRERGTTGGGKGLVSRLEVQAPLRIRVELCLDGAVLGEVQRHGPQEPLRAADGTDIVRVHVSVLAVCVVPGGMGHGPLELLRL